MAANISMDQFAFSDDGRYRFKATTFSLFLTISLNFIVFSLKRSEWKKTVEFARFFSYFIPHDGFLFLYFIKRYFMFPMHIFLWY
jgi:hypothetical protein